jgi:hypothetical protein
MSAFLVSEQTMHRCVAGVIASQWSRFNGLRLASDNLPTVCTKIGQALYQMNVDALEQRYPGDSDNVVPVYRYKPVFINKCDAFKALECLRYQCSEGNVPETELYQEVCSIMISLATSVMAELPAYKSAPWGN